MSINVRYADDTTLVSAIFEKLKISTSELEKARRKWGLKINPTKCAVMTPETEDIMIDNQIVPKVTEFKFLGSLVPNSASDVTHRVSLASQAFGRLRNAIWTSRDMSRTLKIRLYKALILPIAIYGSETWTLREQEIRALLVFEMRCLRCILGVTRDDRLSNSHIRETLGMTKTIEDVVSERRIQRFGHVVRSSEWINISYKQDFTNRRARGRPLKRWSDNIREQCGVPLLTAERNVTRRRNVLMNARGHQVLGNLG